MPVYSYFLFGGYKKSPLQFDLESDSSAIALSICILRDEPDFAQVWIVEDRDAVAVRLRKPGSDIGELIALRASPAAEDEASCIGPSSVCA